MYLTAPYGKIRVREVSWTGGVFKGTKVSEKCLECVMSDIFKDGSVPFPDYDREDTDNFTRKAEFTDDVFIYGNLYANVRSENIVFSETTTLADLNVENIFLSGGISGSSGVFGCLTAKNNLM